MFLVLQLLVMHLYILLYVWYFSGKGDEFLCILHIGKYFLNEIGSTTSFYTFVHIDRYGKDG